MYSFVSELEWTFAENDMNIAIINIEGNSLSLVEMNGKKALLTFSINGIVFYDKDKCYIKTFDYSDNGRQKLIDYVLLYFENNRKKCRDVMTAYRENKNYTKEAFILLLNDIKALGYLNTCGEQILMLLSKGLIDFDKNIVGLHKSFLSVLLIETVNDWNYFFGVNDYKIQVNKE